MFYLTGMHLALVDNNAANLELAKNALTSSSSASSGSGSVSDVKTETYDIDVGEEAAWHEVRDSVKDKFGDVDLLVLNAGVARKGGWENGGYFREVSVCSSFALFARRCSSSAKGLGVLGLLLQ